MDEHLMDKHPIIHGEGKVSLRHRKDYRMLDILSKHDNYEAVGVIHYGIGSDIESRCQLPNGAVSCRDEIIKKFSKPLYIDNLIIHKEHQGKGFAKDALLTLDEFAKHENVDFIFMLPYPLNCSENEILEKFRSLLKLYNHFDYELYDAFECLGAPIPIGVVYGKHLDSNRAN